MMVNVRSVVQVVKLNSHGYTPHYLGTHGERQVFLMVGMIVQDSEQRYTPQELQYTDLDGLYAGWTSSLLELAESERIYEHLRELHNLRDAAPVVKEFREWMLANGVLQSRMMPRGWTPYTEGFSFI